MRATRYTEEEIVEALRQVAAGSPATTVCRELGITETTFYRWRKKYKGVGNTQLQELHTLREENLKLKQIVADLLIERQDWGAGRRR